MLGASLRRLVARNEEGKGSFVGANRGAEGTMARINDKRVHESLANVLISGERKGAGESVFILMEGYEGGRIKSGRPEFVSLVSRIFHTILLSFLRTSGAFNRGCVQS